MKITVASDDKQCVVKVATEDIDFDGHTLNRAVLDYRFRQAINAVRAYEERQVPDPPIPPARVNQIREVMQRLRGLRVRVVEQDEEHAVIEYQ